MINYKPGFAHIAFIWQHRGGVFWNAVGVALPCACLTMALKQMQNENHSGILDQFVNSYLKNVMKDATTWSSFMFLVGFFIIFRTSLAYNRFWDSCTTTHKMRAEWFDAASSLVAYCRFAYGEGPPGATTAPTADYKAICEFQHTMVRLFSMLHAVALAELLDPKRENKIGNEDAAGVKTVPEARSFKEKLQKCVEAVCGEKLSAWVKTHLAELPRQEDDAFTFNLIDPHGIDKDSLLTIKKADHKSALIFTWIQQLVVENIRTGVLSIPAPILSRSFEEIATGMVNFHDAMKIMKVPVPFPYAQTTDFLLVVHWVITPAVISMWVQWPVFAGFICFIEVFVLWSLNIIATQLENPFGSDVNDIDAVSMQAMFNKELLLLLRPKTKMLPALAENAVLDEGPLGAYCETWGEMFEDSETAFSRGNQISVNAEVQRMSSVNSRPSVVPDRGRPQPRTSRRETSTRERKHDPTGGLPAPVPEDTAPPLQQPIGCELRASAMPSWRGSHPGAHVQEELRGRQLLGDLPPLTSEGHSLQSTLLSRIDTSSAAEGSSAVGSGSACAASIGSGSALSTARSAFAEQALLRPPDEVFPARSSRDCGTRCVPVLCGGPTLHCLQAPRCPQRGTDGGLPDGSLSAADLIDGIAPLRLPEEESLERALEILDMSDLECREGEIRQRPPPLQLPAASEAAGLAPSSRGFTEVQQIGMCPSATAELSSGRGEVHFGEDGVLGQDRAAADRDNGPGICIANGGPSASLDELVCQLDGADQARAHAMLSALILECGGGHDESHAVY